MHKGRDLRTWYDRLISAWRSFSLDPSSVTKKRSSEAGDAIARGFTKPSLSPIVQRAAIGTATSTRAYNSVVDERPKFQTNLHEWPVRRPSSRTFRVFVVEPKEYQPTNHSIVFNAALNALMATEQHRIDQYVASETPPASVEYFDLVTFPEAFLPSQTLVETLKEVSRLDAIGCIHVGLRPDVSLQHLFSVQQLTDLVEEIGSILEPSGNDLKDFRDWLSRQSVDCRFNVGCLFMVDANAQLRVCLHPKLVRSKFERSALEEEHMTEANLVSLVTLLPTNNNLLSITLQPLLCSDALHTATDAPGCWPLDAVNGDAASFAERPPDHIDIVSLATCTPQQKLTKPNGQILYSWHQDFRETFKRTAMDGAFYRHHYSTIVLSNFGTYPPSLVAGLSGAFVPLPFVATTLPSYISITAYGRPMGRDGVESGWSYPNEVGVGAEKEKWSSNGYIAALDADKDDGNLAHMLGFTVERLPRDTTRWVSSGGLVKFQLHTARSEAPSGTIKFSREYAR